jgi:hypothetical protein
VNLRKDHCRNLPSRTTREPVSTTGGGGRSRAPPSNGRETLVPSCRTTYPGAVCATDHERKSASGRLGNAARTGGESCLEPSRLSATDISALASMKNVAKCDTWCELQNPANHRVFERKLRPKPPGRGHVCLGVTHRCPQPHRPAKRRWGHAGRTLASRGLMPAAGLKTSPRRRSPRQSVVDKPS